MKVLQINAVYETGSTGRIILELDKALKNFGDKSYVATTQSPLLAKDIYIIGTKFGRKFHALLSRLTGKQGYSSFFATKKLLRFIKRVQPTDSDIKMR